MASVQATRRKWFPWT